MRKQTICFVEPSDIIYLIDDNFEINLSNYTRLT